MPSPSLIKERSWKRIWRSKGWRLGVEQGEEGRIRLSNSIFRKALNEDTWERGVTECIYQGSEEETRKAKTWEECVWNVLETAGRPVGLEQREQADMRQEKKCGQITEGPIGHWKNSGFYSNRERKPFQGRVLVEERHDLVYVFIGSLWLMDGE